VEAWAEKGIVGRGILLDYHTWAGKHGISYNPFKRQVISLRELEAVLEEQGTEVKFGDILLIRTGYTVLYNEMTVEQLKEVTGGPRPDGLAGVEAGEEVMKWMWENFAAVAGDQPSFEAWRAYPLRQRMKTNAS
jgi:hypothetical protein